MYLARVLVFENIIYVRLCAYDGSGCTYTRYLRSLEEGGKKIPESPNPEFVRIVTKLE